VTWRNLEGVRGVCWKVIFSPFLFDTPLTTVIIVSFP